MPTETLPPPVAASPIAAPPATGSPDLRARIAQRLGPKSGIAATPTPEPAKPPEPKPADEKPAPKAEETPKVARDLDEPEPTPEALDKTPQDEEKAEVEGDEEPAEKYEAFPDRRKVGKKLTWKTLRTLEAENSTMRQQLEELRNKVPDPTDHPKHKEVLAKLEAEQKRSQNAEKDLEFTRFERSPRFKNEYLQPIMEANQDGAMAMLSMDVVTPEGTMRAGTPEDWQRIMTIQEPRARMAEAKRMFGEDPGALAVFARHEGNVEQLKTRATRALEEQQAKGVEREKEQAETQQKQVAEGKERMSKLWQKTHAELMDGKDGKWFKPIEGDDEGNAALQAGFEKLKAAFSRMNLSDPTIAQEELAKFMQGQMEIWYKGSSSDRLRLLYQRRGVLMRQMKKELAQYKASEPKDGEGRGVKQTVEPTLRQRVQERIAKMSQ